jgi:hypothetical protein
MRLIPPLWCDKWEAGHPLVVVPVHGNKALKTGAQPKSMKNAGLSEGDLSRGETIPIPL